MAIKIALIGAGKVAKDNYVPFLAARDDVDLGYFTRTRNKADEIAAEYGGVVFNSIGELAAWDPDSVFILTNETQRYAVTKALLEYEPKRIFWEKPLVARAGQAAVTEQDFIDARQLYAQTKSLGVETAMIFNYRFLEQSLLATEIVRAREFGQVVNAIGTVHFACWSHCIDLIHFFAGPLAEVTALSGREYDLGDGPVTGRDLSAAFRTANGGSGALLGTSGMHWAFHLFELTFHFEHGRIRLRGLDGGLEVMDARRQRQEAYASDPDRGRWDQYHASFGRSINAYLDALTVGAPPPVPGIDGLRELQVEAGFRRSIHLGRPIDLNNELPLEA